MSSTPRQTVLITGANTGIGEASARALAAKHAYHVIIGARNLAAGRAVASSLTAQGLHASAVHLDLADQASIEAAAKTIETDHGGKLDVLVNNAGVLTETDPSAAGLTLRQRFERTFVPNVFGAVCVTEAMLPLLRKAPVPRIVFVSSRMGSLANAQDPGAAFHDDDFRSYDCSKAALNLLALNYARMLRDAGGLVNAVCPGVVSTRINGFMEGAAAVETGAERIVEMATLGAGGPTGTFSDRKGEIAW
ncbi:Uu.00g091230.m01.CDS01 [Anthostomella pinea]|uniref:Uu.00g091230.m01.CDS01 n=1 Tax=Anthostomella pinea TaxID=933095 RepID=A0AAI8YKD5_9PEZI|nr:Uu.00g091230.m01.CDS01 [Anthostomella pinea]